MSDMKPLSIPEKKKTPYLCAICQKCNKKLSSSKKTKAGEKPKKFLCGETGKSVVRTCPSPESHRFKAVVPVPGRKAEKAKTFETRNIDIAIVQTKEFYNRLVENNFQSIELPKTEFVQVMNFVECSANYYLYQQDKKPNGEPLPRQEWKNLTDKHINEWLRFSKFFCKALKIGGIDYTLIKVDEINSDLIGLLHSYLKDDVHRKKVSNKYYNRVISYFREFYDYLNDNGYSLKNPFDKVKLRKVAKKRKTIITFDEFEELLEAITPENAWQTMGNGKRRNHYRPYWDEAIQTALETGLRREELMHLQFDMIKVNKNGTPLYFDVEDLKVNRIANTTESEELEYKYIPITQAMRKLLLTRLNYQKYKGTSQYIIAPEETCKRTTLAEKISKAFAHFWKYVDTDRRVDFKHLRKTYTSMATRMFGDKASILTGHSDIDVMEQHYIDETVLMDAAQNLSVLSAVKEYEEAA